MNRLTIAASEKNALKGAIFALLAIALTFVFMPLTSHIALADTFNDFEYMVNPDGTTATITGYAGTGGDIAIPEMIGDKTVTSIGSDLFTTAVRHFSINPEKRFNHRQRRLLGMQITSQHRC